MHVDVCLIHVYACTYIHTYMFDMRVVLKPNYTVPYDQTAHAFD